MSTRKATLIECDSPSCDTEYEHTKSEPAPGYHLGRGYWVFAGGGPIPATYACSADCIQAAVDHNINLDQRQE